MLLLVIAWFRVQLKINLMSQIYRQLHKELCDYRLIINFSQCRYSLKACLLKRLVIKDLKLCRNFAALSSLFDVKKQKSKTNLERYHVVLALKILWTSKFFFP